MNYLVSIFVFSLSMTTSAQLLKTEPIELPLSLSHLEFPDFQNRLNHINDLKTDLKPYTFTNDELDRMRSGSFFISTKNMNKKVTYLGPSTIDLKKELRNVMLKIPGEFGPVRPKGFTL